MTKSVLSFSLAVTSVIAYIIASKPRTKIKLVRANNLCHYRLILDICFEQTQASFRGKWILKT